MSVGLIPSANSSLLVAGENRATVVAGMTHTVYYIQMVDDFSRCNEFAGRMQACLNSHGELVTERSNLHFVMEVF
jgi:hypothetical protein